MISRSRSGSERRLRQMTTARRHSSRSRRQAESSHPSGIRRPASAGRAGTHVLRTPTRACRATQWLQRVRDGTRVCGGSCHRQSRRRPQAGQLASRATRPPTAQPTRLPEVEVEMNDRQPGLRSKRTREGAFPRPGHPGHEDAAAYRQGGVTHRHKCRSRRSRREWLPRSCPPAGGLGAWTARARAVLSGHCPPESRNVRGGAEGGRLVFYATDDAHEHLSAVIVMEPLVHIGCKRAAPLHGRERLHHELPAQLSAKLVRPVRAPLGTNPVGRWAKGGLRCSRRPRRSAQRQGGK
jgi:hypothetical protein